MLIFYMVDQVGAAPTVPEGHGFTVRCIADLLLIHSLQLSAKASQVSLLSPYWYAARYTADVGSAR